MGHSLVLLTASLLAQSGEGQIIEYPAPTPARSCGCQASQSSGPGIFDRFKATGYSENQVQYGESYQQPGEVYQQPERPGFFARLRDRVTSLFGHASSQPAESMDLGMPTVETSRNMSYTPSMTRVTASEPPLAITMPANNKIAQVGYQPTVPATPAQAAANNGVISPKFVNKIGHEQDYSWVTGQLGQANGQWVIHYATPETVDNFGGKLVLAGNANMANLRVGDLISVQGGIMAQNGRILGYEVRNVTLIER